MNKKFELGDWVFYNFELYKISDVTEAGDIKGVHNGYIECGGKYLTSNCLPLTIKNKVISDSFKYYYDDIRNLKNNGLNYPDIKEYLVKRWLYCCEEEDNDKIKDVYKEIDDFILGIKNKTESEVNGVRIFR